MAKTRRSKRSGKTRRGRSRVRGGGKLANYFSLPNPFSRKKPKVNKKEPKVNENEPKVYTPFQQYIVYTGFKKRIGYNTDRNSIQKAAKKQLELGKLSEEQFDDILRRIGRNSRSSSVTVSPEASPLSTPRPNKYNIWRNSVGLPPPPPPPRNNND